MNIGITTGVCVVIGRGIVAEIDSPTSPQAQVIFLLLVGLGEATVAMGGRLQGTLVRFGRSMHGGKSLAITTSHSVTLWNY